MDVNYFGSGIMEDAPEVEYEMFYNRFCMSHHILLNSLHDKGRISLSIDYS